jgi:hypothetical protein
LYKSSKEAVKYHEEADKEVDKVFIADKEVDEVFNTDNNCNKFIKSRGCQLGYIICEL